MRIEKENIDNVNTETANTVDADSEKSKKKPDMVFVFPLYDTTGMILDAFTYGLGSASIRAYLHQEGLYTEQYLQDRYIGVEQTAREIVAMGSDVVGFTCFDISVYACALIADEIKKINPRITVVFGGPAAILSDEVILTKNECVDICCRGEGEITTLELLAVLKSNEDIGVVKGISYRSGGKIVRTPARELVTSGKKFEELDVFPSPILMDLLPAESVRKTGMITSRGCTFKCTYCTNTALHGHRIRYHSKERIIAELKHLAASIDDTLRVVFYDDAFTLNVPRGKEICRMIIGEELPNIIFDCLTRIDNADDELFRLFAEAGFVSVGFGLESASPEILNRIKKVRSKPAVNGDYTPEIKFLEAMKKNIQLANSHGLTTLVSIILGLPGETRADAENTLRFVKELGVHTYLHNYLVVITGTEISRTCEEFGIKLTPSPYQLPALTEYSYDVFAVEPLENSYVHGVVKMNNERDTQGLLYLLGTVDEEYPKGGDTVSVILLDEPPADNDPMFTWMAGIVNYATRLFIVEESNRLGHFNKRFECFANGRMPLLGHVELYRFTEDGGTGVKGVKYTKNAEMPYYMEETREENQFYLSAFDDAAPEMEEPGQEGTPKEAKQLKSQLNFNIKTVETVQGMSGLLDMFGSVPGEINLTGEALAKMDCLLLDKCRWGSGSCDACELNKIIVRGDGVYPCYTGKSIGKVGESVGELKTRLEAIRKETLERRGCETCEVKDGCSKCIFMPDGIGESEYCAARKKRPHLWQLAEIPEMLKELKHSRELTTADITPLRISRVNRGNAFGSGLGIKPLPEWLLLLEFDGGSYFCDVKTFTFSPVSRKMLEVLRQLEAGNSSKDRLSAGLAEKYNVSLETAGKTLNVVIKKINTIIEECS